jgi:LCP family protein required for cell wall assembly
MVRPGTGTPLWGAAGKAGYALSCLAAAVVLVISGFSFFVVREVVSIGSSYAIQSGPSIGAQNILLMGLESRTYWNGQILPADILADMHAGSVQGVEDGVGGNTTNTLILIHIPAGGKKAVGFSIPRDDWVNFADTLGPQQSGKIDQAYGASMAAKESQLREQDPNMSPDQVAFEGNEAGRAATVATVEQLTGVHIDHFAEINLFGFYELAKVLGGVNVCLKAATHDSNAGANFRAGYQHLDASQALAFVRQRDNLPNGDLDRTHRQQAFLDSVMQQLSKAGVLADLTKISALLSVAKQYVITDSGWNLLDFAAQMRYLTGSNIVFSTLPIVRYQTIDGQDANVVNPGYIKSIVQRTFYPPASTVALSTPAASAQGKATAHAHSSTSPSPSPSSVIPTTGPQGGPVSAVNGIPCVY